MWEQFYSHISTEQAIADLEYGLLKHALIA